MLTPEDRVIRYVSLGHQHTSLVMSSPTDTKNKKENYKKTLHTHHSSHRTVATLPKIKKERERERNPTLHFILCGFDMEQRHCDIANERKNDMSNAAIGRDKKRDHRDALLGDALIDIGVCIDYQSFSVFFDNGGSILSAR